MNVELLETVRQAILYRPKRFCAAQWAFARNANEVVHDGDNPQQFKCCIAGHVLLESGTYSVPKLLQRGGFHSDGHPWEEAGTVLGLTEEQWRELFFPSQWDKPYKQDYYLSGREEEAEIAASYIDHFISKHADAASREAPAIEAPTEDATTLQALEPDASGQRVEA